MTMLWPEDESEAAQPKLHNAVCALRRSLNHGYNCEPGCGYILCKNRVYHLNPKVAIQTDVDEFLQCYQIGQQISEERISLYERASRLYTGPFLSEDIYADWSFLRREQLNRTYLAMCRELVDYYFTSKRYEDAAKWTTAMLKENHCDEVAHRYLMQVYAAQGHRCEALQQYRQCERLLREDLGVSPLPETTDVFQKILKSEFSSANQVEI
jgi:DNA-binding SARP family transcriptional activator